MLTASMFHRKVTRRTVAGVNLRDQATLTSCGNVTMYSYRVKAGDRIEPGHNPSEGVEALCLPAIATVVYLRIVLG